jgi:hypothetical protein
MAVFQDFQWASFVRDGGNNIAEFQLSFEGGGTATQNSLTFKAKF